MAYANRTCHRHRLALCRSCQHIHGTLGACELRTSTTCIPISIATAATVIAIASAPPSLATPDEQSFVDHVHANGIAGNPDILVSNGKAVCKAVNQGLSLGQVANNVATYQHMELGLANMFVADCELYLCS